MLLASRRVVHALRTRCPAARGGLVVRKLNQRGQVSMAHGLRRSVCTTACPWAADDGAASGPDLSTAPPITAGGVEDAGVMTQLEEETETGTLDETEGEVWNWTPEQQALFKDFLMALYEDHETMDIMWRDHYIDNQLWLQVCRKLRGLIMHRPHIMFPSQEAGLQFAAAPSMDVIMPLAVRVARTYFLAKVEGNMVLAQSADLRLPHTWYPTTRLMQRKIIYHAGPTNSGKTFNALKRLREAKSGVYCGPLRLLALEIFETLNIDGVFTSLITGQERQEVDWATHVSCTVEVVDLEKEVDVAVIDEIQMIGDPDRGWAWTQAVLGVQAREIHVCGDPAAIPVLERLAELTGDIFEVQSYERRKEIHSLRSTLELKTGNKCCVVYGKLPPETRSAQARLFNSEDDSTPGVLVASDAIGMGLNLNIRRVVFASVTKFDGKNMVKVPPPSMKQIAGRAGRFGSRWPVGQVTCLYEEDMPWLHESLAAPVEPMERVGLLPNAENMEVFAKALPGLPLKDLLERYEKAAVVDGQYFLCRMGQLKGAAGIVADTGMSLADQFSFSCAPVNTGTRESAEAFKRYAEQYGAGDPVHMDLQLPLFTPETDDRLGRLEARHQILDTFLWLARRFPGRFMDVEAATQLRIRAADMLEEGLEKMSANTENYLKRVAMRQRRRNDRAHQKNNRRRRNQARHKGKGKPARRNESRANQQKLVGM